MPGALQDTDMGKDRGEPVDGKKRRLKKKRATKNWKKQKNLK